MTAAWSRARAPNLTIRGGALVDRVLFGDACPRRPRAIKTKHGRRSLPRSFFARGHDPPSSCARAWAWLLKALGIAVRNDLPHVGQNLMDHPILRANLAQPGFARKGDARPVLPDL